MESGKLKILIFLLTLASTLSLTVACDTTTSTDGDLNNWWYLTQVDTLANGKTQQYREQRVFWSFQGSLMQVECPDSTDKYVCKYQKGGNTLYQNQLYRYDRIHGDVLMTQDSIRVRNLGHYAITQPQDTFTIESLTGDNLTLRNRPLRLHFDKY